MLGRPGGARRQREPRRGHCGLQGRDRVSEAAKTQEPVSTGRELTAVRSCLTAASHLGDVLPG